MAMASRAPGLKDTERVGITSHALEKLRERLPAGSHLLSMPDSDLRLRAEEAWKNASRADTIETWYERGPDNIPLCNWVVDFRDSFDAKLSGLFRADDRQTDKPVLITVLSNHMVENNKHSGAWAKTPEEIGEKRLLTSTPMRSSLAGMKPEVVTVNRQQEQQAAKAASTVPPTPAPPVTEVKVEMEDLRKVLVVYEHPETRDALFFITSKGKLAQDVQDLVDKGIDESTFQFWTPQPAKIKKTISIDF
jgi:hypothetical protein